MVSQLVTALVVYDSYASHSTINSSFAIDSDIIHKQSYVGKLPVRTYHGTKVEETYAAKVKIQSRPKKNDSARTHIYMDFLLSPHFVNKLSKGTFKTPKFWVRKYNLPDTNTCTDGISYVIIGQDSRHLFPRRVTGKKGLQLLRSQITGNLILSGTIFPEDDAHLPPTVNFRHADPISNPIRDDTCSDDSIIKLFSSDSMNDSPLKKCAKCLGCPECKKTKLPTSEQASVHSDMIHKSISYSEHDRRYTCEYPHNTLLDKLPTNEKAVLERGCTEIG